MVPSRTTNHQYGTDSIFSCNFSALSLLPSPGCKMDLRNASTRVYQFCLPIDSSHLACISLQLTIFPVVIISNCQLSPWKILATGGTQSRVAQRSHRFSNHLCQFNNHKDGDSWHPQLPAIGRVSPIRWNGWTCRRTWSTGRSLRKVNSRGSRCLADEPPDMFWAFLGHKNGETWMGRKGFNIDNTWLCCITTTGISTIRYAMDGGLKWGNSWNLNQLRQTSPMGTWIWSLRQHPTWVVKFHIVPLMLVAILHCMQNQNTSHQMLVYYCTNLYPPMPGCAAKNGGAESQRASMASFFNKHTAPWWKLFSKWSILEDGHQLRNRDWSYAFFF